MKPTTSAVAETVPSLAGTVDGTMELAGMLFALFNAEVEYAELCHASPAREWQLAAARVGAAREAFSTRFTALIDARVAAGIAALATAAPGVQR